MKKVITLPIILLFLISLSRTTYSQEGLLTGTWVFVGAKNEWDSSLKVQPYEEGQRKIYINLTDDENEGKLSGRTFANVVYANYHINPDCSITFSKCGGTKVGEASLFSIFSFVKLNRYCVENDSLHLYSDDKRLIYKFKKQDNQ